jgi:hypothetical protein
MEAINSVVDAIVAKLSEAAAATAKVSSEAAKVKEKAVGAYTLFVEAAKLSPDAETLEAAAEVLFGQIRASGTVTGPKGKAVSLGCKPNKEGTGFIIPSAISSAKSVMVDALTRAVPLKDEEGDRAFSAIRKDVQAIKAKERRETATGDEAMRFECRDLLSALSDAVDGAKGDDLAAILSALRELVGDGAESDGETLAQAA